MKTKKTERTTADLATRPASNYMNGYKRPAFKKTKLAINKATIGEMLETKIERIVNNKEPIKDGAPIIYTERKDGVQPQYDIRTDRFEIAVEAMDKVASSYKAKREERIQGKKKEEKKDGGAESIQATGGQEPAPKS